MAQSMNRYGVGADVRPYYLRFDPEKNDCWAASSLSLGVQGSAEPKAFPTIREAAKAHRARSCMELLSYLDDHKAPPHRSRAEVLTHTDQSINRVTLHPLVIIRYGNRFTFTLLVLTLTITITITFIITHIGRSDGWNTGTGV